MKRSLIIDGDIVLFQIGRVTEDITVFGDDVMESYDHKAAVRMIDLELEKISKKTGYSLEEMVFSISSATNYRKKFFPTYKSNRKHIRKPLGLKAMRQHMLDNIDKYQTIMMEDLEADDVMGIYGTAPVELIEMEVAIYSQDKDLFTIPIKQWDFKKHKFIVPEMVESLRFLYSQVLTGDVVDGYKGCPKIGKVKAGKALKDCNNELEMLEACHRLYLKEYKEEAKEKLLIQIGQARILHHTDSLMLMQHDIVYNPYVILDVTPIQIEEWEKVV